MAVLVKDPQARLDYAIDWSDYLDDGESIVTSAWLVAPAGELVCSGDSVTGTVAQVMIEGGGLRQTYVLSNRIATSLGRIDDRSLTIRVQER